MGVVNNLVAAAVTKRQHIDDGWCTTRLVLAQDQRMHKLEGQLEDKNKHIRQLECAIKTVMRNWWF